MRDVWAIRCHIYAWVIQGPDLHCFVDRIASHPERLHHIYFDTVLLLRAVARLSPYLDAYDYCSTPEGVHEHEGGNIRTKEGLKAVMEIAKRVGRFDESVLFKGENANVRSLEYRFKSQLTASLDRS